MKFCYPRQPLRSVLRIIWAICNRRSACGTDSVLRKPPCLVVMPYCQPVLDADESTIRPPPRLGRLVLVAPLSSQKAPPRPKSSRRETPAAVPAARMGAATEVCARHNCRSQKERAGGKMPAALSQYFGGNYSFQRRGFHAHGWHNKQ